MNVLKLLMILMVIQLSSQTDCDTEEYCDECTYCGKYSSSYCSCDFYNSFCMNNDKSEYFS